MEMDEISIIWINHIDSKSCKKFTKWGTVFFVIGHPPKMPRIILLKKEGTIELYDHLFIVVTLELHDLH